MSAIKVSPSTAHLSHREPPRMQTYCNGLKKKNESQRKSNGEIRPINRKHAFLLSLICNEMKILCALPIFIKKTTLWAEGTEIDVNTVQIKLATKPL